MDTREFFSAFLLPIRFKLSFYACIAEGMWSFAIAFPPVVGNYCLFSVLELQWEQGCFLLYSRVLVLGRIYLEPVIGLEQ